MEFKILTSLLRNNIRFKFKLNDFKTFSQRVLFHKLKFSIPVAQFSTCIIGKTKNKSENKIMAGKILSDEEEFSEEASDFENYFEKTNQTTIPKKVS